MLQVMQVDITNEMIGLYVSYLDDADPDKLIGIMKKVFMENQHET